MKQTKFYWARYKSDNLHLIEVNNEKLENDNDWFIVQRFESCWRPYYKSTMGNHYIDYELEVSDFAIERPYNDDELHYLHEQEEELKKLFNIQD